MNAEQGAALIGQYEPLCWRLARKWGKAIPAQEWEELAAAARVALVKSARTFDPGRGVSFMTYAYRMAEFAVRGELRACASRGVHVPGGYNPLRVVPRVGSGDAALDDDGACVLDWVAAPEPDERPDWPADFWERARRHLSDRQYQCLILCYREGLPQVDVAKRLGVTRSAVQQYCKLAVEKLRKLGVFDSLRDAV
jgi:RNA polymerase sigma factor (sigma-70 family)